MKKTRFIFLAGMVLVAAASRLIPHPLNFTPIAALAMFGGASFARKRAAFLVPFAALFLGDLVMGFYSITPVIYGSFALIACLGFWLRGRQTVWRIAGAATAGAVLFFLTTNFGWWALSTTYPKTPSGLIECYFAGIPYFRNTLLSDLIYSALLFGGLALAEKRWPILATTTPATA